LRSRNADHTMFQHNRGFDDDQTKTENQTSGLFRHSLRANFLAGALDNALDDLYSEEEDGEESQNLTYALRFTTKLTFWVPFSTRRRREINLSHLQHRSQLCRQKLSSQQSLSTLAGRFIGLLNRCPRRFCIGFFLSVMFFCQAN